MIPFNKQVPIKVLSMVKHIAILDTQTVVLGVCVYHTVVLGREPGTSLCRKVVLGHVPRTGLHGIVITEHLGTELNLFCSFPPQGHGDTRHTYSCFRIPFQEQVSIRLSHRGNDRRFSHGFSVKTFQGPCLFKFWPY